MSAVRPAREDDGTVTPSHERDLIGTREWRVRRVWNGRSGVTGADHIGPFNTESRARERARDSLINHCDEVYLESRPVGAWEDVGRG